MEKNDVKSENQEVLTFNVLQMMEVQKNRYPYLLLDKITACVPGKYVDSLKNLTYNEWFFPPHYDDGPIMPGALILEAMAQTAMMTHITLPGNKGNLVTAIEYSKVHLKKQLVPGDQVRFHAELLSYRRGIAKIHVDGYVDGELVCDADIIEAYPDQVAEFAPKPKNEVSYE